MHEHSQHIKSGNIVITIGLNLLITITEIAGGLLSNSLSLLSDAFHNLSDTIALLISLIANKIGKRESNLRKTFGYKRIEILSALINSFALIVIIIFLIYQAILRFQHPEAIKGVLMFVVATIGLFGNLAGVLLLKKDSNHNLNIRAAYLHLLGDTFSSVAVIAGSILIYFYKIYWLDPLLSILICAYIFYEALKILKETVDILMQGTPKEIDLVKIKKDVETIDGVKNIHHLHAWNLNDNLIHFEGHVILKKDMLVSDAQNIRNNITIVLKEKFHIQHVTLQIEHYCSENQHILSGNNDGKTDQ